MAASLINNLYKPNSNMPSASASRKPTLTENAFDRLRDLILDNQLRVGAYYLEQELAELLGISRTPVREAVIRLEQDGLVNIIPRRGVFIKPISPDEMREIYEVLSWLESAAITLACKRPVPSEIMAELELSHSRMQEALTSRDLDKWSHYDNRFHQIVAELSQNSELIKLMNSYSDKTDRVRSMALRIRELSQQSLEDHSLIITSLRNGNANVALKANREHRARACEEITNLLALLGGNGINP